jgi:hypothetical protein
MSGVATAGKYIIVMASKNEETGWPAKIWLAAKLRRLSNVSSWLKAVAYGLAAKTQLK